MKNPIYNMDPRNINNLYIRNTTDTDEAKQDKEDDKSLQSNQNSKAEISQEESQIHDEISKMRSETHSDNSANGNGADQSSNRSPSSPGGIFGLF